ncbi:hypothetical protein HN451_08210, partial [archaeon]|nr:hypothetical protein [archaeon]
MKTKNNDKIFYVVIIILIIILTNTNKKTTNLSDENIINDNDKIIEDINEIDEIISQEPIIEKIPVEEKDFNIIIDNNEEIIEKIPTEKEFENNEIIKNNITLEILQGENEIELKWTPFIENLKYYKVIRSTKNPDPKYPQDKFIKTISDPDTINFVDTKFKNGLINYYIIAAIKNDMSAVYSNVVIIDLRNPEDQVITLNGEYKNNEVILNWKKPNKPVKYYRVIRSSTNPFPTYPQDSYIKTFTNINDTTYTDLDTLKDEYNYYGITIIFGDNSIGYSNPI